LDFPALKYIVQPCGDYFIYSVVVQGLVGLNNKVWCGYLRGLTESFAKNRRWKDSTNPVLPTLLWHSAQPRRHRKALRELAHI